MKIFRLTMQIQKLIRAGASLAVMLPICVAAMTNEPTEFRGIGWAAPIENHKKDLVVLSQNGDLAHYRRPSDQMSWGGAEIQKISYRFFKGRFSGSTLQLFGASHQKAITEKLFSLYGTPEQPNKRVPQFFWTGEKAKVVLFCEVTNYCVVDIASLEQLALEEQARPAAPGKKEDD
jgi:hypothetical protein